MPCVRIFGVPMDLGQNRRGVDMGPSAIRYAGLQERLRRLGYETHDGGNIIAPQMEEVEHPFHGSPDMGLAHHLPQITTVCQEVYRQTIETLQHDDSLIFLGGDHSVSLGTVAAMAKQDRIGVLWVDAHGDFNTPHTTPSGNVHGMVVAALLGDGPPELVNIGYEGRKLEPAQVAMVGIRDLDPEERRRLVRSGIVVHTMRQVDEHGMATIARLLLDHFIDMDHIHVSLDLDALDPSVAPGVGTAVPGGLAYREAHLLMEILADSGKVRSMDIVEVNPILDRGNITAQVAVELAASLFGQRIL
ncbi:MAG: arginase [Anaerolineae bacterium]|nr:arginase [Anaerolineae bacterium]